MIDLLKDIGTRTNGDIYFGVVGPVRTGKSSFIKRFMELGVIPYIEDIDEKKRAIDELPQSASGNMIMTVEPKFVPNNAARINIDQHFCVHVRLVDCVGYVIDGAKGYSDEQGIRYVKTPWYLEAIPFDEAAKIGTKKVISDHSTIGIVMTCDGSLCDIDASSYKQATCEIIDEMLEIGKPFIVIVNSSSPSSIQCNETVSYYQSLYNVPILALNVLEMNEEHLMYLLKEALYEFPIGELKVEVPRWMALMDSSHWLKNQLDESLSRSILSINRFKDIRNICHALNDFDYIEEAYLSNIDTSGFSATLRIKEKNNLYNEILNEILGQERFDSAEFLKTLHDLTQAKKEYDTYKSAIEMVKTTGYGYALPMNSDIEISQPELIKAGNRYGMKIVSSASTIHMIKIDIESVFEPIIGTKQQAETFIDYIDHNGEMNREAIFDCDVFGRKLGDLIHEGMSIKLSSMNDHACVKVHDILHKIVNKGKSNVIAIVL